MLTDPHEMRAMALMFRKMNVLLRVLQGAIENGDYWLAITAGADIAAGGESFVSLAQLVPVSPLALALYESGLKAETLVARLNEACQAIDPGYLDAVTAYAMGLSDDD